MENVNSGRVAAAATKGLALTFAFRANSFHLHKLQLNFFSA